MTYQLVEILSVNHSQYKGKKVPVDFLNITNQGVEGDFSLSSPNSWVCLLDQSQISLYKDITKDKNLAYGEFGEHITVKGLQYVRAQVFDRFVSDNVVLEVVRKGTKIPEKYREPSDLLVPGAGIFCRVLKSGTLKAGESFEYIPKIYTAKIISLSDRAARGEYEDLSGVEIKHILEQFFDKKRKLFSIDSVLIPDSSEQLGKEIWSSIDENDDLIITTGGTGIGKRDITVKTILPLLDKKIPGIMEMIRLKYGMENPNALLSTGVAGVKNNSLIYTLPGSVGAVREYMAEILKTLEHAYYMLHGIDVH